ncbi:MAG TPA: hypothetical protein VFG49_17605 [Dyella sp.]|uniref:hypothetical protein n=1 Tax=Dyella sp. TaxID=1869338 RepID=UPI002D7704E0|nr:hypothetical protein [Dyella sp.]HET6555347.1 hypothetical protein [Dyella sp.]
MKTKGLVLATVGLIIVVGVLVQRSYSSSAQPVRKADPQADALPLTALHFVPIDHASYELGFQSAKSGASAPKQPADWVSYWIGYGEEKRAEGDIPPRTGSFADLLHEDQRCIQGEVLTVRESTYAKTKDAAGSTFLCNRFTVLPSAPKRA